MNFTKLERHNIQRFVKDINQEYKVSFQEIFEADIYEEEVFIGIRGYAGTDEGQMFVAWFEKEFGFKINTWLIALLHEIGHLETTTEELEDDREERYTLLEVIYEDNKMSIEELNNRYFKIPCEYAATTWAVDYYLNHKNKCENLLKELHFN